LDVMSPSSGSAGSASMAVVGDGLVPAEEGERRERVLWALLPQE